MTGFISSCEFCMMQWLLCYGCYAGLQVSGVQDVHTQEVCPLHPSCLRGTSSKSIIDDPVL